MSIFYDSKFSLIIINITFAFIKYNRHHIRSTIIGALRHGTSPRQLALTCALGVTIGIFPIWGTTTWICFGLAIVFRLNIVILQLINYLMFPLQLLLLYPFVLAGVTVFGISFRYTADQFLEMLKTDFATVAQDSGFALLSGAGIWLLCAVPLFFLVFFSCLYFFQRNKPNEQVSAP